MLQPSIYIDVKVWPGESITKVAMECLILARKLDTAVCILWEGTDGIPVWPSDSVGDIMERWDRAISQTNRLKIQSSGKVGISIASARWPSDYIIGSSNPKLKL